MCIAAWLFVSFLVVFLYVVMLCVPMLSPWASVLVLCCTCVPGELNDSTVCRGGSVALFFVFLAAIRSLVHAVYQHSVDTHAQYLLYTPSLCSGSGGDTTAADRRLSFPQFVAVLHILAAKRFPSHPLLSRPPNQSLAAIRLRRLLCEHFASLAPDVESALNPHQRVVYNITSASSRHGTASSTGAASSGVGSPRHGSRGHHGGGGSGGVGGGGGGASAARRHGSSKKATNGSARPRPSKTAGPAAVVTAVREKDAELLRSVEEGKRWAMNVLPLRDVFMRDMKTLRSIFAFYSIQRRAGHGSRFVSVEWMMGRVVSLCTRMRLVVVTNIISVHQSSCTC